MIELSPESESQLPESVRLIRAFFREHTEYEKKSLSEIESQK